MQRFSKFPSKLIKIFDENNKKRENKNLVERKENINKESNIKVEKGIKNEEIGELYRKYFQDKENKEENLDFSYVKLKKIEKMFEKKKDNKEEKFENESDIKLQLKLLYHKFI